MAENWREESSKERKSYLFSRVTETITIYTSHFIGLWNLNMKLGLQEWLHVRRRTFTRMEKEKGEPANTQIHLKMMANSKLCKGRLRLCTAGTQPETTSGRLTSEQG